MKQLISKHIIDPIVRFLKRRLDKIQNEQVLLYRDKLINSLGSVGYGLKLNGENWFFSKPKTILIGNNVHIGNNAYFKSDGGIIIGDNTHISRNVTIYTTNHDYNADALPYNAHNIYKPVIIEQNVWIGMNVTIVPGVTIGEGAIIGIGTLVNRNIMPLEIVGSPKTQYLKSRDTQHYNSLNNLKSFGGISGKKLTAEEQHAFLPSYYKNKNLPIVFILGTGRSGTKSISEIFNQDKRCKAYHENIPQLIRLSTELAHNPDKANNVTAELKQLFNYKIWNADKDQILIHSDQRLWNLIPFLADYFPNARFLHITRDPVDSVISMASRKWYEKNEYPDIVKHDWAKYRLNGSKIGFYTSQEWSNLNAVEKCAWYWAYVNAKIKKDLEQIATDKKMSLNLNSLSNNLDELATFIGIGNHNLRVVIKNKRKVQHHKQYETLNQKEVKKEILAIVNQVKNKLD